MSNSFSYESHDEHATVRFGAALGHVLKKGAVVALCGDLGAGKTVFTKGMAKGLGSQQWERVKSPTFTIVNEIDMPVPMYHFDIYRLSEVDELLEIGFEEYLTYDGVVVIEWAQKFEDYLPAHVITVVLEHRDVATRRITIFASEDIVSRVKKGMEGVEK